MVRKNQIHIFKNGSGIIGVIQGGDLVGWLQDKLNPPELHLPGYQYCGPFTKLEKRLQRGDLGINRVDKACKKHDIEYSKTKDNSERHRADQELINDLDAIDNPTFGERAARMIIKPIIKTKKKFGLGGFSDSINKTMKIYCVKCKDKTDTKNYHKVLKNNRNMGKGICVKCGTKKNVFLGKGVYQPWENLKNY